MPNQKTPEPNETVVFDDGDQYSETYFLRCEIVLGYADDLEYAYYLSQVSDPDAPTTATDEIEVDVIGDTSEQPSESASATRSDASDSGSHPSGIHPDVAGITAEAAAIVAIAEHLALASSPSAADDDGLADACDDPVAESDDQDRGAENAVNTEDTDECEVSEISNTTNNQSDKSDFESDAKAIEAISYGEELEALDTSQSNSEAALLEASVKEQEEATKTVSRSIKARAATAASNTRVAKTTTAKRSSSEKTAPKREPAAKPGRKRGRPKSSEGQEDS